MGGSVEHWRKESGRESRAVLTQTLASSHEKLLEFKKK